MRLFNNLFFLFFFLITLSVQAQQSEYLIWNDEFDGTSLDLNKWDFDIGTGSNGWGNNELQYYTSNSQNVKVEDGVLKITALNQSFAGSNYTSSRIVSRGNFAFSSGKVKARIKLPEGQGIWPAFWMLPEDFEFGIWPASGEIDILEILGQEPNKVHGTVHYGRYSPNNQMTGATYQIGSPNFTEDFHLFEFEWKEDELSWFVDGFKYNTIKKSDISNDFWPFDRDFHFLLNVAVGGNFPGSPNASTPFPAQMEVDYVRVFQNPNNLIIKGPETVYEGAKNVQYSVDLIDGITYDWILPLGATIVSGQGTNTIIVDWGVVGGNIMVEMDKCCAMQMTSTEVEILELDCFHNILDDNGNKELHWVERHGTLNENVPNPNISTVNSSSHCTFYQRNPDSQFDFIRYLTEIITDASDFESGDLVIEADIYSNAPIGTSINVQFENHELALSSFPSGRRTVLTGNTTAQNQWETISFSYNFTPDFGTPVNEINNLLFLFAPNSFTNYQFYLDNVRIVDPSCQ